MSSINFNPRIIAHRGASKNAPENTLAAFSKAKELGANWVEFDVMLSACGEAVVIHDETLNRTTNGRGRVCDYPYSYIKTLDAGSWFDPMFSHEYVPTLTEVIQLLHQLELAANIEIKPVLGHEKATVIKVLDDIKKYWTNGKPLISSFSYNVLEYVRQYSSEARLGFLMDRWQKDWERMCNELQCVSVHTNQAILNPARVEEMKKTNRNVLCYTVNDAHRAKELFGWGVDAVFSDDAALRV